jgi:hypothetical protein
MSDYINLLEEDFADITQWIGQFVDEELLEEWAYDQGYQLYGPTSGSLTYPSGTGGPSGALQYTGEQGDKEGYYFGESYEEILGDFIEDIDEYFIDYNPAPERSLQSQLDTSIAALNLEYGPVGVGNLDFIPTGIDRLSEIQDIQLAADRLHLHKQVEVMGAREKWGSSVYDTINTLIERGIFSPTTYGGE